MSFTSKGFNEVTGHNVAYYIKRAKVQKKNDIRNTCAQILTQTDKKCANFYEL